MLSEMTILSSVDKNKIPNWSAFTIGNLLGTNRSNCNINSKRKPINGMTNLFRTNRELK